MSPTWLLYPSKLYHRLLTIFCLFILFELVTYWQYGYHWQVLLLFILLILLGLMAYQNRVVSIQFLAGQWVIETLACKMFYAKSIKVCWCSAPAMVLLLKLHHFPYRKILLIFSDQFQDNDEHSLRWYLLVKNASYHV